MPVSAKPLAVLLLACSVPLFAAEPATVPAKVAATRPAAIETPPVLHPKGQQLDVKPQGPFVILSDGSLLCIEGRDVLTSTDDGRTWESKPLFPTDSKMTARPEQGLVRMRDGTLVFVFLDDSDKRWKWDKEKNTADGEVHLYVWAIRSVDEGKTWTDLQRIQDGYSGAVRDIIEYSGGNLVVPVTKYLPAESRHATVVYVSPDKGKTWKATRTLDIGGRGHHDGAVEATLVELKDKRIWMLLRTSLDAFYESFSSDGGLTWSEPVRSQIAASSSPAMVKRLSDGLLVLLWNQLNPSDGTVAPRRSGQHSAHEASWFRGELSIAFSNDDGKLWSKPQIVASNGDKRVSYPYVLERSPGDLWITTMQGNLRMRLKAADFTAPQ